MSERNLLIIGASSGIGAALAQQLTHLGNHHVYVASRREPAYLPLPQAVYLPWDVRQPPQAEVLAQLPEVLHGVVYCPGSITLKPFNRLTSDDFRQDWEINVMGAVNVLQSVLSRLKKADGAAVVLFSTVAAQTGMGFHASVAAAKAAVEGLGKALAAEWAAQKIRVNILAPSLTDTPLAGLLLATPEKREAAAKRHPLARTGSPTEVAAMAGFLLSEDAGWITGQVIAVDGGLSTLR